MKNTDKQRIVNRYNERLAKVGPSFEALASGTPERRNLRFRILREIGITDGDSVLDLGCGFGDFYEYLKSCGLNVRYSGIDINPSLIEAAKKKYPDADFRVLDLQEENPGRFDFVVSTSCFNLKLADNDNYEFVEDLLAKAYGVADKGVAVDFLTSYVDFQGNPEEAFYYSPETIFGIGKKITKRVTLRHDYPLFEFCLYLFPDFKGWLQK